MFYRASHRGLFSPSSKVFARNALVPSAGRFLLLLSNCGVYQIILTCSCYFPSGFGLFPVEKRELNVLHSHWDIVRPYSPSVLLDDKANGGGLVPTRHCLRLFRPQRAYQCTKHWNVDRPQPNRKFSSSRFVQKEKSKGKQM